MFIKPESLAIPTNEHRPVYLHDTLISGVLNGILLLNLFIIYTIFNAAT